MAASSAPNRIGAGASFHGGGLVTDQPSSPHLTMIPKIKGELLIAVADNDDKNQPAAKDKLKDACAAANVPAKIEVYTVGQVICRPTQQAAEDYYRHAVIENADWGAVDNLMALQGMHAQSFPPEALRTMRSRFAAGQIQIAVIVITHPDHDQQSGRVSGKPRITRSAGLACCRAAITHLPNAPGRTLIDHVLKRVSDDPGRCC